MFLLKIPKNFLKITSENDFQIGHDSNSSTLFHISDKAVAMNCVEDIPLPLLPLF
ncbi:MAG: hypothetical protein ACTS7E_00965 [Arsenophonus sp. NC-CH8-MAG3]